jgi:hypothetical protein
MDVNLPSRTEHCFQQMAGRPEYYLFCQHPGQIPGHFQASWLSSRFPAVSNFYTARRIVENTTEGGRDRPKEMIRLAITRIPYPARCNKTDRSVKQKCRPAKTARPDAKKSRKSGSSLLCKIQYTSERG